MRDAHTGTRARGPRALTGSLTAFYESNTILKLKVCGKSGEDNSENQNLHQCLEGFDTHTNNRGRAGGGEASLP